LISNRNGSLDYAKLLASFGIVWFHSGAVGASYGYAGLTFFLILLVLFIASSAQHSKTDYMHLRAKRLLLPWLLCCLLYGSIKLAEVWLTSARLDTEFNLTMLLTGPAIHLWFLPFAFVVSVALYPLMKRAASIPQIGRFPLAFGFGLLTLLCLALRTNLPVPLAQWAYALPSITFALCLAFSGGGALRQVMLISALGLIGLSAGWAATPQLILAAVLLALCTTLPLPGTALSGKASRAALLVYLLHPLISSVLTRLLEAPADTVIFASLTIVLTVILAFLVDTLWHARMVPFFR
jgi:hypothetical protein